MGQEPFQDFKPPKPNRGNLYYSVPVVHGLYGVRALFGFRKAHQGAEIFSRFQFGKCPHHSATQGQRRSLAGQRVSSHNTGVENSDLQSLYSTIFKVWAT